MAESDERLHFLDYWRILVSRKEVFFAVAILVVLSGIAITYSTPKTYMASSVIKVKEETPDVQVFNEVTRYDPLFLRTQFEIIQSEPIIEETVRRTELDRKLSKAYGYDNLPPDKILSRTVKLFSKWLKVQQFRDTNLIEIRVYLSEPKESVVKEVADAANMVAAIYRDQNLRRSRDATERALRALGTTVDEQTNKVQKAQSRVDDIRQRYKIDLLGTVGGSGDTPLRKMTLVQLESQRIKAKVELADKQVKYEKIKDLPADKLLDVGPRIVGDQALAMLISDKRKKEVDLSERQQALGPKHPQVVSLETVVSELDKKIQDAVNGLKISVQTEFEAAKATLDVLDREVDKLRTEERQEEGTGYREYKEAVEDMEHAKRVRDALEMRYIQQNIEQQIPRTTVEVISAAKPPDWRDPVSPNVLLNVILSLMAGLGAGIGLAFFVEYLDTSVKTIEDIERDMGVPVLAVIPQKVRPLNDKHADASHAEAYRVLRTNLQFSRRVQNGKIFCVTSGSMGEGKSQTAFNLAHVCAQLGDRVLVIDADLHRPRQHKILGMSNDAGLASVLMGDTSLEDAIVATPVANMDILTSGRTTGGVRGLMDTKLLGDVIRTARDAYDMVLIDTPPIIGVSDTSMVIREVDGVILVIQHRKYPRWVSVRAKSMIDNIGATLAGVVLNNINVSRDYSYYYYHHYGSYYYRKAGGNEGGKA